MAEHPLNFIITSELAGITIPRRAKYERWEAAFVSRWGAVPELTEPSRQHATAWQLSHDIDLDECTFTQAVGIFLAHHLRTPLGAVALFMQEVEQLRADYDIPLDDEDWNRIESEDWQRNRVPGKIQIDMNPRAEERP